MRSGPEARLWIFRVYSQLIYVSWHYSEILGSLPPPGSSLGGRFSVQVYFLVLSSIKNWSAILAQGLNKVLTRSRSKNSPSLLSLLLFRPVLEGPGSVLFLFGPTVCPWSFLFLSSSSVGLSLGRLCLWPVVLLVYLISPSGPRCSLRPPVLSGIAGVILKRTRRIQFLT